MNQRIDWRMMTAGLGLALVLGGATGCSDSTDPTSETGTLRMTMVDAPAFLEDVEAVEVVFEEVRVHRSQDAEGGDGGWMTVLPDTLPVEDRTFDLLQLVNGVFVTLGEVDLATGTYTQVRIMVESATITVDGVAQDLFIPSGYQSGIKLIGPFTIDPDEITDLTLDFDLAQSLHEAPPGSGNFILRPTIRLIQTVLSGSISGTVEPVNIGAVVYALSPATGDTMASTLPDTLTGDYRLQALLAGVYDVRADAAGHEPATRLAIEVVAGQDVPDVDFVLAPQTD
ncbi:MAG TPA: DUF4382 domain-containing protein [Candidatus Krumholzibacteria bacterium]|nr:DUF4382 domain-containing protein [Candidatus Krumholzibacteria bacterium]HPD73105.1 DUF4382 domain-containing protein [Candidatus Krumholzibacteria bacterium]HRY41905.1 DUF4382 domain-containing protein [Candidatus Krumholzibacteria bacterium]